MNIFVLMGQHSINDVECEVLLGVYSTRATAELAITLWERQSINNQRYDKYWLEERHLDDKIASIHDAIIPRWQIS